MKRICSWCNNEMPAATGIISGQDHIVTHGICETCAAKVLADLEEFDLMRPESLTRNFASADTCSGSDHYTSTWIFPFLPPT